MKTIILNFLFLCFSVILYSQKVVICNHNINSRDFSNKYLACQGGNTSNNTSIILWEDEYQKDIMWIIEPVRTTGATSEFKIKNEKSNKYLAVAGAGNLDGSKIVLYDDIGQRDIIWTKEPAIGYPQEVKFKNVSSGKFLAVEGGEYKNGAALVLWSDEHQLNINWRIITIDPFSPEAITGGMSYIQSRNANLVMAETSTANFSNVVQRIQGTGNALRWSIERNGIYYKIKNKESNRFIGVKGASNASGAEIVITSDMGQEDILWEITMYGPHSYKFRNKKSGLYIAVSSASHSPEAKLVQWADENQLDILWGIYPAY